jgi:hypothetical protein
MEAQSKEKEQFYTHFLQLVQDNELACVDGFLHFSEANIIDPSRNDNEALGIALNRGHVEMVKLLLNNERVRKKIGISEIKGMEVKSYLPVETGPRKPRTPTLFGARRLKAQAQAQAQAHADVKSSQGQADSG